MYKKSVSLLLVLACLALAAACGKKDDQVSAVIKDINTFTDELVQKVESAPDVAAGVDAAQKHMDARKNEIRERWNSIKNIGENQVSDDAKKKMQEDLFNDGKKMGELIAKHGSDPAVREKLQKLLQDFQDLFKM